MKLYAAQRRAYSYTRVGPGDDRFTPHGLDGARWETKDGYGDRDTD